jgi:hypothetical protein
VRPGTKPHALHRSFDLDEAASLRLGQTARRGGQRAPRLGDEEGERRVEVGARRRRQRIAELERLAPDPEDPRLRRLARDPTVRRQHRRGRQRVGRHRPVLAGSDPHELERRRRAHAGVDEHHPAPSLDVERVLDLELEVGQ